MSGSVNMTSGHIDNVWPDWIDVNFKLPEKSGEYLCYKKSGFFDVLNYSKKHQKFNANDDDSEGIAVRYHIPVTHWMPLPPEPPKEV